MVVVVVVVMVLWGIVGDYSGSFIFVLLEVFFHLLVVLHLFRLVEGVGVVWASRVDLLVFVVILGFFLHFVVI